MKFVVPGQPVAKGRPRFARRGKHVVTFTPEKTRDYERMVGHVAKMAMLGSAVFSEPVSVSLRAYFQVPASWSKKKRLDAIEGRLLPASKNDLDNIAKGVCDGMNEIVFADDGLIVDLFVSKRYAEHPRMEVEVWPASGDVFCINDF